MIFFCIKGGRKNRILYINKLYIRISCMAVSLLLLWTQLDWKGALWIIFYSFSQGCSLLRSRTWTPFCLPSCAQICQIHIYLPTSSVGTNPKNSNFEHSNFGMSELRTSWTYFKKYKSNSNFKGRTSNFYKDEYIMILRHFTSKFLKIYFSVVNSRKMLPWFLSHFLEVIKIFATQNEGRNISV